MQTEDEFQAEKARLLAETAAANKRTEEAQAQTQELKLDTQLWGAYAESGGIGNNDDRDAYEAIKRHLKDSGKLQFENGQPVFVENGVVELGNNGPKTVTEKMAELRQHSTFQHFFSGDAVNGEADSNSQQPKAYTREDARIGKANINDIASGKASVENLSGKPDFVPHTKKVSVSEVAKMKSRGWK